ncbi:MAG: hypothetical protein COB66_00600 [Coxiella sp. (in: Bacteria)]|nr:MAG: hypothetical protein COB66_00600 [Coxiella sp. (in: g-proteobacteria)]
MMEQSARYLVFNGIIMLLAGLLAGIPYGTAITKKSDRRLIEAWRVTHLSLPVGATLMLAIAALFPSLVITVSFKWWIAILYIVSAYGFMLSMLLGPPLGHRGLSPKGSPLAKLVYTGNMIGSVFSLFGTIALLYAGWLNL